jgi:hypothetical protein
MGKLEKIAAAEPPAPRAPAVLEQRPALERELADLKQQIAETALAAYEGKSDGREKLAALDAKIRACAFQLDCNGLAHEHALRLDHQAVESWKATIQTMPPEQIIAGISVKDCARLCSEEHGCVITLGQQCGHPVKSGVLPPRLQGNPAVRRVYVAATAKLKLRGHG